MCCYFSTCWFRILHSCTLLLYIATCSKCTLGLDYTGGMLTPLSDFAVEFHFPMPVGKLHRIATPLARPSNPSTQIWWLAFSVQCILVHESTACLRCLIVCSKEYWTVTSFEFIDRAINDSCFFTVAVKRRTKDRIVYPSSRACRSVSRSILKYTVSTPRKRMARRRMRRQTKRVKGQRSKLHQRLVVQNQETDKLAPVNRHRWWLCHVAIYTLHSIVTVQLYIAANSGIIMVQINELWLHNLILEFAATIERSLWNPLGLTLLFLELNSS